MGPVSLIAPDANPRFTAAFGQANKSQGWGLTREKQEKITDGGRQVYEKVTGYATIPQAPSYNNFTWEPFNC